MPTFRRSIKESVVSTTNKQVLSSSTHLRVPSKMHFFDDENDVEKVDVSHQDFCLELIISPKKRCQLLSTPKVSIATDDDDDDDEDSSDSPLQFLQVFDKHRSVNCTNNIQHDELNDCMIMMKSCSSLSACTFDDDLLQSSTASLFSNFDHEFGSDDDEEDAVKEDQDFEEHVQGIDYRQLSSKRIQFGMVTIHEYSDGSGTPKDSVLDKHSFPINGSENNSESDDVNDDKSISSINTYYSFASVDEHDKFVQKQRRINFLHKEQSLSPIIIKNRCCDSHEHHQYEPTQQVERKHVCLVNRCA